MAEPLLNALRKYLDMAPYGSADMLQRANHLLGPQAGTSWSVIVLKDVAKRIYVLQVVSRESGNIGVRQTFENSLGITDFQFGCSVGAAAGTSSNRGVGRVRTSKTIAWRRRNSWRRTEFGRARFVTCAASGAGRPPRTRA